MKTPILPLVCSFALTAMSTAGLSYWWSVRQFVAAMNTDAAILHPTPQPAAAPSVAPVKDPALLASKPTPSTPAPAAGQKEFYEALIAKMEGIQTQNRDLLDQLAETNRDLMKLEFRVDTHSESFRPLPVSEDRPVTNNVDNNAGVLPPRAEPVVFPTPE